MTKNLKFSHPLGQLILSILTIFFIINSVQIMIKRFNSTDDLPRILRLESDDQGFLPKSIKCGFFLKKFLEFNHINNKFVATGSVWFESLPEIVNYLDDFSIGQGSIVSKSKPLQLIVNGINIVKYEVKIEFFANLTYKYFPLEDHLIFFSISNQHLAEKGFALKSSMKDFNISNDVNVDGWELSSHNVISGYENVELGEGSFYNNYVVFLMDFKQTSNRLFLLLIMPLLICLLISILSFSFDSKWLELTPGSVHFSCLTAMIAYRYVIESSSPRVSYYIFSDVFFYHIVFFISLAFYINSYYRKTISPVIDYIVLFFYLLFAFSWHFILKWWFNL